MTGALREGCRGKPGDGARGWGAPKARNSHEATARTWSRQPDLRAARVETSGGAKIKWARPKGTPKKNNLFERGSILRRSCRSTWNPCGGCSRNMLRGRRCDASRVR